MKARGCIMDCQSITTHLAIINRLAYPILSHLRLLAFSLKHIYVSGSFLTFWILLSPLEYFSFTLTSHSYILSHIPHIALGFSNILFSVLQQMLAIICVQMISLTNINKSQDSLAHLPLAFGFHTHLTLGASYPMKIYPRTHNHNIHYHKCEFMCSSIG